MDGHPFDSPTLPHADTRRRVPWRPEALSVLQSRYAAAIANIYDIEAIDAGHQPRPSNQPQHVFDWADGLRLIVSRDRFPDGRTAIHVSGSLLSGSPLNERLIGQGTDPLKASSAIIWERWQDLAQSKRDLEEVRVSPGGVPHLIAWDTH